MDDIDILLSMVENPTRRKILESLVKEPHYPLQLSKELGISQQAVMKNLSILEKNGMVDSYQESSSIGPMRTFYEPSSEFTLVIDMRNGMFSARIMEPNDEEYKEDHEVQMEGLKKRRERISEIDKKIDELNRERSRYIRERETLMASAIGQLNDSSCGYAHKSLMYEILNEPDRSIDQLSSDLGIRKDIVENMVGDIEYTIKKKGGNDNEQQ
jgi:ArsR family transcriptional regulator